MKTCWVDLLSTFLLKTIQGPGMWLSDTALAYIFEALHSTPSNIGGKWVLGLRNPILINKRKTEILIYKVLFCICARSYELRTIFYVSLLACKRLRSM